jgi:hypothetical protein
MQQTLMAQTPRQANTSNSLSAPRSSNIRDALATDQQTRDETDLRTAPIGLRHWEGATRTDRSFTRPSRPVDTAFVVSGLERLEGHVTEADESSFITELATPGRDGNRVLQAEFPLELLSREDDVRPGDFVYVTIRRVRRRDGLVSTTTSVRLRRLGSWTEDEITRVLEAARREANELEGLGE